MMPFVLLVISATMLAAQQTGPIPFGSALDADRQIAESQQLAKETAAPQQRAKGDQHRTYHFSAAKTDMPYR
jgi:Tfp pilus assembly protein PilN